MYQPTLLHQNLLLMNLILIWTRLLVLFDFSKAFDMAEHRMLIEKLNCSFNFDNTAFNLIISSYLSGLSQCVVIDVLKMLYLPASTLINQDLTLISCLGQHLSNCFFRSSINAPPIILNHHKLFLIRLVWWMLAWF